MSAAFDDGVDFLTCNGYDCSRRDVNTDRNHVTTCPLQLIWLQTNGYQFDVPTAKGCTNGC